jgi:hypothetical protein
VAVATGVSVGAAVGVAVAVATGVSVAAAVGVGAGVTKTTTGVEAALEHPASITQAATAMTTDLGREIRSLFPIGLSSAAWT